MNSPVAEADQHRQTIAGALRFARVLRHRPDKSADDADTVADVEAHHAGARPS